MCCGSRRAAWRSAAPTPVTRTSVPPPVDAMRPAAPAGPWAQGAFPTVSLRYHEAGGVQARGAVTGRAYTFSGDAPVQAVDVRDATALLQGPAFRPA